jgi:ribonuclease Z
MAAMWHCHVIDGYIDQVFDSVRSTYTGAATLCQDLTVFNVTPDAVIARQAHTNPVEQAVLGPSETKLVLDERPSKPDWWSQSEINWQSKLATATAHS